jgi:hypothetical protein
MTPGLRRLNLTAHVASSVGWLGAVVAFLVLSIAGLTSQNADIVRGSYLAMNLIGQFVIVPLSVVSLGTGLVQSLGTHWGLVQYYWVLTKFALTVFATILLLLHQFTAVAGAARRMLAATSDSLPSAGRLGTQLVIDAGLAILVLLTTTTLSVFKPWGRTRYARGRGVQAVDAGDTVVVPVAPLGVRLFYMLVGLILVTIVILHLTGRGLGGHGM